MLCIVTYSHFNTSRAYYGIVCLGHFVMVWHLEFLQALDTSQSEQSRPCFRKRSLLSSDDTSVLRLRHYCEFQLIFLITLQVQEFYAKQNMALPVNPPLVLVEPSALESAEAKEKKCDGLQNDANAPVRPASLTFLIWSPLSKSCTDSVNVSTTIEWSQ